MRLHLIVRVNPRVRVHSFVLSLGIGSTAALFFTGGVYRVLDILAAGLTTLGFPPPTAKAHIFGVLAFAMRVVVIAAELLAIRACLFVAVMVVVMPLVACINAPVFRAAATSQKPGCSLVMLAVNVAGNPLCALIKLTLSGLCADVFHGPFITIESHVGHIRV